MKRLYIARHAKSGWDYTNVKDIDRVLAERGISDAYLMATCFVKDKREIPEIIYSSPATRAIHTALIFSRVSGYAAEKITINSSLYGASQKDLLSEISKLDDRYNRVMLFGHNDGFTHLVNYLMSNESIDNLPTAAIACIDFEISNWEGISNLKGNLQFLYRPKELK
jgi:phosphohistidine phosphatase